uniref:Uncharacterized protein n=1 Tax=Trichobilharzia regenti TaxID=157069 RepID=A0AA85J1A4_TRIRE|nr:unnamed protein product [Trichobilharzia regenti]
MYAKYNGHSILFLDSVKQFSIVYVIRRSPLTQSHFRRDEVLRRMYTSKSIHHYLPSNNAVNISYRRILWLSLFLSKRHVY